MKFMADVRPAMPHQGTTLASCLCSLMQAVGRPEWTMARLQGVLGHAFQFDMKEGGQHVNHDHLDWGPALDLLPQIAQFQTFMASAGDTDVDLAALKREVRDAVLAGLKRGIPALAWSPMDRAIAASHHHGVCWGLLIGYDEADETFTIRHPFVDGAYQVRYDEIGHAEPEESIWVMVYDRPTAADERAMHLTALRNAVAYAHSRRYAKDDERNANRRALPHGFAAYDVWQQAFTSADVPVNVTHHHLEMLMFRRVAAANYLRELCSVYPEAAEQLEAAASYYDREMESLNPLHDLCDAACDREAWLAEERARAGKLIDDSLKAERKAIAHIEAAVEILGEK